jgi:hypothetical protein
MRYPQRVLLGRAARGSVAPERWPYRPPAGTTFSVQGHRRALEGQPSSLPLSNRVAEMGAKTRDLLLLAAGSLFIAVSAWSSAHPFFASVFFAFAVVAIVGAAERKWR